jgi:hypothetical protein
MPDYEFFNSKTCQTQEEDDFEAPKGLTLDLDCVDIYDERGEENQLADPDGELW